MSNGNVSRSLRNANRKELPNSENLLENRRTKSDSCCFYGSEPETHEIRYDSYMSKETQIKLDNLIKDFKTTIIKYNL